MNNQSFLVNPDLRVILDQERDNSYSGLNCVRVGTIVSFNAEKQSVSVKLVNAGQVFNQGVVDGTIPQAPQLVQYPILQDVPAFVLFGGSAYIGMPIAEGDPCIVIFSDRDLDPWWTNGTGGAPPNSLRMHSMADGIALVGIRPAVNPVPGLPTDGNHISIGNASGTLRSIIDQQFAVIAQLMSQIDGLMNTLENWTNTDSTTPDGGTVANLHSLQNSFSMTASDFADNQSQYDALFQ
jgi:hypothetical protein